MGTRTLGRLENRRFVPARPNKPGDPLTFLVVAGLLTGVAVLASYVPGRRATRVDPVVALRAE